MVSKSLLLAMASAFAAGFTIVASLLSGTPVTLAVGPMEINFDTRHQLTVEIEPACYRTPCPLAELRFGADTDPVYRLTL